MKFITCKKLSSLIKNLFFNTKVEQKNFTNINVSDRQRHRLASTRFALLLFNTLMSVGVTSLCLRFIPLLPAVQTGGFSPSPESYSRMKLYLADDIYDFQSCETLPTFILSLAELRFWRCYHLLLRFPFHRLVSFDSFVSTIEKMLPTIWKAQLNGIKVVHGLP